MKNVIKTVVLSIVVLLGVGYALNSAKADIHWLPQYQGAFKTRVGDAKSPTLADPTSCEAKGWVSSIPHLQTCRPRYLPGNKKCYDDCKCPSEYRYVSGKGAVNGCPNGKTVSGDSCGGFYKTCSDCSTNSTVSAGWSTTPKTGSNIAKMSNYGVCADYYYTCNSGFVPTSAVTNAYLHTGAWNWISCGANQKAVNQDGSTGTPKLCQKCEAKVCSDYNSGYVAANDTTKNCTKINKTLVGNLDCWSCVACDTSIYKYDTGNCASPKIIGTDKCNNKASTCACPTIKDCGLNTCKTQAPSGCSGCLECNTCPNLGKYITADCTRLGGSCDSANYEACSEKYRCITGKSGTCPSGYICDNTGAACSGQYLITGCALNYIYMCNVPNTNCTTLGYTQTQADCSTNFIKCPFDVNKRHCF